MKRRLSKTVEGYVWNGSQVPQDRGELSFEYSEDSILEHSTEVFRLSGAGPTLTRHLCRN